MKEKCHGCGVIAHNYRGYHYEYDPPPIPVRKWDWQFWHCDYDGAPDSGDTRHGAAASEAAVKVEIDEQIQEECEERGLCEWCLEPIAEHRGAHCGSCDCHRCKQINE